MSWSAWPGAFRRRLTWEWVVRQMHDLAGGWYYENFYFREHMHRRTLPVQAAHALATLPLAWGRQLWVVLFRRLEFTRVELPITTRCTLRCRDCANLIPFYPAPADLAVEDLLRDVDEFLALVEEVHSFSVMGGEALVHPGLPRVLAHLIAQPKIALVQLVTNGTRMPSDELLAVLAHPKVVVSVSDYPLRLAPRKPALLATLEQCGINHVYRQDAPWKDFGGLTPEVAVDEPSLVQRFQHCWGRQFHNLLDGQLHLCPRSAHGARLGQFVPDRSDFVQCRSRHDRLRARRELRRLRRKPYLAACTRCKGGVDPIPAALQLAP